MKYKRVFRSDCGHALEHDSENAEDDRPQKDDVKPTASFGVSLEDYFVKPSPPSLGILVLLGPVLRHMVKLWRIMVVIQLSECTYAQRCVKRRIEVKFNREIDFSS